MTNRLDEAIDRAVREMTQVDSEPAIRGRVLTQLEHPGPRVFTFVRLALATAAAVLILLVLTRAPHPPRTSETVSRAAPAGPVVVPSGARDGDPASVPDVRPRPRPNRSVTAAMAVEPVPTIPALPEIAPLVVPSPEAADIEPDAVVIAPLAVIPDVRIDPLPFPPGSRD